MLPLVSSTMPEADRHALVAEVRDLLQLVLFVDDEVSWPQPGHEPPVPVETVAVTLTRSTPLRKRNSSCFCPATLAPPAITMTASAAVRPIQERSICFMVDNPYLICAYCSALASFVSVRRST